MNGLIQSIILGMARSAVMALGGWLLTKGYLDSSTVTGVEGSLICLAGAGFSVFDKMVVDSKLKTVAGLPAPLPVTVPASYVAAAQASTAPGMMIIPQASMQPIPNP